MPHSVAPQAQCTQAPGTVRTRPKLAGPPEPAIVPGIRRNDGTRFATVGICTLQQTEAPSPEAQLADNLSMIDAMAGMAEARGWRLDVALLPEVSFKFAEKDLHAASEDLDGRILRAIGGKARELGAYATAPILRRSGDAVLNSLVLLDRTGNPVGVYDKVHPVMMRDGSLEFGIAPGREFPVFDLDFGRVGMQICWDVAFGEGWQALADQDAELVLFATNPAVPLALRGYAWRHGYYVATSTVHPVAPVVDPIGRVVAATSTDREVVVVRVNLDYRVVHSNCMWDWSLDEHPEYAGRMKVEWDAEAHEYLVSSPAADLPVRRFLSTEGLLTGRQRNGRNIELLLAARGGPAILPSAVVRE
jgi:predicted amidohydrolase